MFKVKHPPPPPPPPPPPSPPKNPQVKQIMQFFSASADIVYSLVWGEVKVWATQGVSESRLLLCQGGDQVSAMIAVRQ